MVCIHYFFCRTIRILCIASKTLVSWTFVADVSVSAYGTETSLKNVAQVAVRDGRTLVIHVYDESTIGAVEKAIRKAGLNLNPVREGDGKLKVPVPRSSKTTRDAMKEVSQCILRMALLDSRQVC